MMNEIKKIIFNKNEWHLKKLALCHIAALFLLFSWCLHITHPFWETWDISFYRALTGLIDKNHPAQIFWAISNHNLTDWFHDIVMLLFFGIYLTKKTEKSLSFKIAELIFFALLMGFTIILINRYLCLDVLHIQRKSPSLICDFAINLSQKVEWIKVKNHSVTSYPGDHGTTAILFAMSMWHLLGRRAGIMASIYSIYWILPRLITGCHWLTDVIMGSLVISMVVMSWAIYTPWKNLSSYFMSLLFKSVKQNEIIPR